MTTKADERAMEAHRHLEETVGQYLRTVNAGHFEASEALSQEIANRAALEQRPSPVKVYGRGGRKKWLHDLIERYVKD